MEAGGVLGRPQAHAGALPRVIPLPFLAQATRSGSLAFVGNGSVGERACWWVDGLQVDGFRLRLGG